MSTIPNQQQELDRCFQEWSEDRSSGNPSTLKTWLERYPQFTTQILDWHAYTTLQEAVQEEQETLDHQWLEIQKRVKVSILQKLNAPIAAHSNSETITDLFETIKQGGYTPQELASETGITKKILKYLNQRLVKPDDVRFHRMLRRIAFSLRTSESALLAYMQGPPNVAVNASYRSSARPAAAEKISFEYMIQSDSSLTEAQKSEWLNLS